jgi:hypothetical protein
MITETGNIRKSRFNLRLSKKRYLIGLVILIILSIEILLRYSLGLGHPLLFVLDPDFGSMPAPNQDIHRFFSHIQTNAYGMRSVDFNIVKQKNEKRILFVGDSVTFGTSYVDQRLIFTSLINEYYMSNSLTPIVILNASAAGWAPSNELGYVRSKGIFDSDIVVFVLNTKDLIQPFAKYQSSPMTPTSNPYSAIGEAFDRYIIPRIFGYSIPIDPGSEMSDNPQVETKMSEFLSILTEEKNIVEKNGARFMIIFSPAIDDDIKLYKIRWNFGIDMLMTWSLKENIKIIDMRNGYSRYSESQIYFDGMHLRPLGHQIIKEEFINKMN